MFKQKNKNKFQLEKDKIPIRKRKIFQLEKGKHSQYELVVEKWQKKNNNSKKTKNKLIKIARASSRSKSLK